MSKMNIDLLVSKHNFIFLSWDDNFGGGVWAVCVPLMSHAHTISWETDHDCLEMVERSDYLLKTDWLPVVIGRSLTEAMAALEARLEKLPADQLRRNSDWWHAIFKALDRVEAGPFDLLPVKFSEFISEQNPSLINVA